LTYNSSALVGSTFGGTWEDPGSDFFKFTAKELQNKTKQSIWRGKFKLFTTSAGSDATSLKCNFFPYFKNSFAKNFHNKDCVISLLFVAKSKK